MCVCVCVCVCVHALTSVFDCVLVLCFVIGLCAPALEKQHKSTFLLLLILYFTCYTHMSVLPVVLSKT